MVLEELLNQISKNFIFASFQSVTHTQIYADWIQCSIFSFYASLKYTLVTKVACTWRSQSYICMYVHDALSLPDWLWTIRV